MMDILIPYRYLGGVIWLCKFGWTKAPASLSDSMHGPYCQKERWSPFVYQGQPYYLDHLNEYVFCVPDSESKLRKIVVTFGDHCFTRPWTDGDAEELIYPNCSRQSGDYRGCFCIDRYQHSLELRKHIQEAISGKVWKIHDDNMAIMPTITHHERKVLYSIVFSLDRVKGLPLDLHMRVKSAFPNDRKTTETFGHIRFPRLVTLRMQGKSPQRITDRGRQKPQIR
jgi:hypothetical protein